MKQQSLAAQKQAIEAIAEKHHIQHINFYSDKQSGRKDNRSGYRQITQLIQQGQCDILCCYRLNRLHRNLKNALKLIKLCQTYHVHILSVHDGYFDMDQAFDRLKLNIFISLAELESDNIGEQVRNGLQEKAKQGRLITTHAPFGYEYHNGTFIINQNESPTVKAVFNYYIKGHGYKKIAQLLEEDNTYINRQPYQVRNIIINPNYCGRVNNQYGQFDNMFPSIVSTSIYEQAQRLRLQKQTKQTPSDNQLKQKIKCPCCNATLTNMTIRKKNHTLRYYVCPKNMNASRFVCDFKGINAQTLEDKVLEVCRDFYQNQRIYTKIKSAIDKRIKRQRNIEKHHTLTQEQLIEKLAQGIIDAETFREQTQSLRQQPQRTTSINGHQIQHIIQNIIQKRFTLNILYPYIETIHITKDKNLIGIYFKNEPLNIVNQTMQSSIAQMKKGCNIMQQLKTKRVGIYVRVSTEMQSTEGYSIDGQINQIKEYCDFHHFEVKDIYADRGISGKSMNRPELQRMLKDAKEGNIDCVMVYKTNRLARNTSDLLKIVEDLHKQNVEFFSLSERMEVNTSSGKLMLQILASFSEFERNNIVENVFMGQTRRAQEGYYQGNLPLGYDKIPDSKHELMINQHEANIVKYIFECYAKGHGYRKIANALNHKGYVTKKGKPFSISSITYILANPFYIGKIQFAKYKDWSEKRRKGLNDKPVIAEGKHSPIINQDLWDKVQMRKKQVSQKPQVHGKGTNLLTGIIHCPQCGAPMAASNTTNTLKDGTKKRIRYYSCSNFRNKGSKVCSANSVRADVIEDYVMKQILEIVKSDKVIQRVVTHVNQENQVDGAALHHDIAYKQQQYDEVQIKINNLIKTIEDNPDLTSVIRPSIQKYEKQLNDITNQINQLKNQQNEDKTLFDAKEISKLLQHIFHDIKHIEKSRLKALYLSVIDRIDIKKDGNHKKQFYVTLKLNNEIIKQLFNNKQLDEVHLSTSSLFLPQTLYLTI